MRQELVQGWVEQADADGQALKLAQVVATGGQAKVIIQSGQVRVNRLVETRRGRKLRPGDRIEVGGEVLVVMSDEEGK